MKKTLLYTLVLSLFVIPATAFAQLEVTRDIIFYKYTLDKTARDTSYASEKALHKKVLSKIIKTNNSSLYGIIVGDGYGELFEVDVKKKNFDKNSELISLNSSILRNMLELCISKSKLCWYDSYEYKLIMLRSDEEIDAFIETIE